VNTRHRFLQLLCVMAALAVGCQQGSISEAPTVPDDAAIGDDRIVAQPPPPEAPQEPLDPATVVTTV
jgi:hypothetical protein